MVTDERDVGGTSAAAAQVDVVGFLVLMWARRKWIAGWVSAVTLAGVVYALVATPSFYAEATISPREGDERGANLLSQLGGVGGAIAARMVGSSNNLDKVEVILKSDDLAEAVIRTHDLMPVLFRDEWDSTTKSWKSTSERDRPTLRRGMMKLWKDVLRVSVDAKKNTITIGATADDSVLARQLVAYYIDALNDRTRDDVMRNAEQDRNYLEEQLIHAGDPFLREKIQQLIAMQIEKSMLVRSQAFEVLKQPYTPMKRSSPNRKRIVFLSFMFGLFSSAAGILGWIGFKRLLVEFRARAAAES